MKKILFLVFFVMALIGYSQEKITSEIDNNSSTETKRLRKGVDIGKWATISPGTRSAGRASSIGNYATIGLVSGISTPSSSFSDNAFAENGTYFELSGAYYFSKFGFGVSLGQYTNPTDNNLESLTNSLSFPTENTTEDWKITYYGLGPEYTTSFNKIQASFFLRTGVMSIKPITLQSNYNENSDISFPIYNFTSEKTSKVSYFSTAIKIGYNITQNLNVFATADYLSALSNELTITEKTIVDANGNGTIDREDFLKLDAASITFDETVSTIKPQTTNFGIGINYSFGTKKHGVGGQTHGQHNRGRSLGDPIPEMDITIEQGNPSGKTKREKPGRTTYDNITLKRSQIKKTIVLTNPSKEKTDKKDKQRKLINILPKNNSNFNSENEIKNFSWKLIGEQIIQPNYLIEITKIGNKLNNKWVLIAKTNKPNLSLTELFKQNSSSTRVSERLRHKDLAIFTDGNYQWKVTETTTGTSSNHSYFTMTQCEIDFTIANEEIECLGYDQKGDRKFKICFDATYLSASGDLTYVDPSSGLTVYDQTYATLTYTLVSPNPTLVTQIGATVSTVSYCFEVTVPSGVTSIGFGLQGDDLDPSPITCQPGVSLLFDELPSCLCDECEEVELSFDNFNITPNGGTGNQFNFNGNINVNVPIYGIEFQIQSYTYSASPSACTEGVSSIEESGMILMPGTTINSSTSLQLFNETASGSASSNNNATKDIKYTSNTPMSGPIPINLTIGLPGPISGLDPSCCVIDYTVCIKVKIFYEEGNCKSCVFTHCLEFNNQ